MTVEKLTREQQRAIASIDRAQSVEQREFRLGGLAGTGKTFVAAHLARTLGWRNVGYVAPTAKAARVLAGKLAAVEVAEVPTTIHGLIYNPIRLHCHGCPAKFREDNLCHGVGSCGCKLLWEPKPPQRNYSTLIVDEASMVSQSMYDDLNRALPDTFKVYIGDHGQLPPVNSRFSLMNATDMRLEKVHRQVAGSPILQLAMKARRGDPLPFGVLGDALTRDYPSGLPMGRDAYDEDALMLAYTNAERVRRNKEARTRLRYKPHRPQAGDRVICRRNNKQVGIFNGQRGRVLEARPAGTCWDVDIELIDDGGVVYSGRALKDQFHSHQVLDAGRSVDLWDYGYCLTVHNAQGSEASRVVLIEEQQRFIRRDDWYRWLYTGITRAKDELTILVIPDGR